MCQVGYRPPAKSIQMPRLDGVGHVGCEAIDRNHVVLLALAVSLPIPVESVLPTPHKRTDLEMRKAKLFSELTPQSSFYGLAGFKAAPRRNPKIFSTFRRPDSEQEGLPFRREENGSDGFALDNQRFGPEFFGADKWIRDQERLKMTQFIVFTARLSLVCPGL